MADLAAFMGRVDVPALAQGAIAHAQFETIHPFGDGNGRTGRALLHSVLLHAGAIRHVTVPISAGLLAVRDEYFEALTAYRSGDLEPILRCVAGAARSGVDVGERLVGELRQVREAWSGLVNARSDSAVWGVMDLLLRQPVVTARVVTTRPRTFTSPSDCTSCDAATGSALPEPAALPAPAARSCRRLISASSTVPGAISTGPPGGTPSSAGL